MRRSSSDQGSQVRRFRSFARRRGRLPRRVSRPNWFQRNREWVVPLAAVLVTAAASFGTASLQTASQAEQAKSSTIRANKQTAYTALLADDISLLTAQAKQVDLVLNKSADPTQVSANNGELAQLSSKVLLDVQIIRMVGSGDVADRANKIATEHSVYPGQLADDLAGRGKTGIPQIDVQTRYRGHNDTLTGQQNDGSKGLILDYALAAEQDIASLK